MDVATSAESARVTVTPTRHLDDAVGEYIPKFIGGPPELGTASTLREFYRQNLLDIPGRIVIGRTEITTTPEVTAVLRALLYTGCCRIEGRSDACREIFVRACRSGEHIGAAELLGSFEEVPENPFTAVIQNTIRELLAGAT